MFLRGSLLVYKGFTLMSIYLESLSKPVNYSEVLKGFCIMMSTICETNMMMVLCSCLLCNTG